MVLQLKVEVLAVLQMDQEAMLAEFRTTARLFSILGLFASFSVRVVSIGEVYDALGFQKQNDYHLLMSKNLLDLFRFDAFHKALGLDRLIPSLFEASGLRGRLQEELSKLEVSFELLAQHEKLE